MRISDWSSDVCSSDLYGEQWRADRSEAEILAQQTIDMKIKAKRMAEIEAAQKKRQAEFQRLDNQLDAWGLWTRTPAGWQRRWRSPRAAGRERHPTDRNSAV